MKPVLGRRLVQIDWFDSEFNGSWYHGPASTKPLLCHSVGWLWHDGDEVKTISPHISHEDEPQRKGEMTIPVQVIIKIKDLR